MKVTDHLNNEYPNLETMCSAYNVKPFIYEKRIKKGWTQEQALLNIRPMIKDLYGREYPSMYALIKGNGYTTYSWRKFRDKYTELPDLLKAIERDVRNNERKITDHLGKVHKSVKHMLKFYDIKFSTYDYYRWRKHLSCQEAMRCCLKDRKE